MMKNIPATWDFSLYTECPRCSEKFDLVGFSILDKVQVGECGTNRTTGVAVGCPRCSHEFEVDFEY